MNAFLEEDCLAFAEQLFHLVIVNFICAASNTGCLFLSVCPQVTHIEFLRRDCGTGRLLPSLGPPSVLGGQRLA